VRLRAALPAVALFVLALAVWEALVRGTGTESFVLPAPSAITGAMVAEWPTLWTAATGTLLGALGGLLVGAVAAAVVALVSVRSVAFRAGALPFAVAASSTPIIVLAPVANAWFGLTSPLSTITVVAVLVFFPIMVNLVTGLLSATASEMELMATYAAGRRTVLAALQAPSALPFAFSALKIAVPLALIGAIVKEYFGGPQDRLGQYITSRAALFQFEEAWAAIVLASAFGIALYLLVVLAERWAMPWHPSVRAASTA
jgi:NitT/TauT family transport system permease protein